MVLEPFDSILRSEYARRRQEKPKYSLRMYARDLGTDVSQLSKFLRAKRNLSHDFVAKVGPQLGLHQHEIERHQNIIQLKSKFPGCGVEKLAYTPLSEEEIDQLFNDRRLPLIFEIMKTAHFQPNVEWLSDAISCPLDETADLVGRLISTKIITVGENGGWQHNKGWSVTSRPNENVSSVVRRKHEEEVLKLAIEKLNMVPIEERDQSSMTMATSKAKIQQAKKMITRFRRELCAFLEDAEEKDTVYQMSLSLFPLTKQNP